MAALPSRLFDRGGRSFTGSAARLRALSRLSRRRMSTRFQVAIIGGRRVGWTAETVEQDDAGVRVGIVSQRGEREIIEADYAVGCDGSHSTVRDQVGIARDRQDFDQLMVLAVIRSRELHEGLKRFPPR